METSFEAAHGTKLERHEVEEKRAVGFRRQADQLAARLRRGRLENVLQIRCLTTQPGAVVNNLAVDFSGGVVDEGHMAITLLFTYWNRLSMSSSVISPKAESSSRNSSLLISSTIADNCCETCRLLSFTRPRLDRSSKTTINSSRPTTEM